MSTTRTKQQLATAVMRRLALTDVNKEPTANERAHIEAVYDEVLEDLSQQDKVYWISDSIPIGVFNAIVRIVAEEVCPTFGVPVPTEQDESGAAVSIGNHGRRILDRHMARSATGLPVRAQYF